MLPRIQQTERTRLIRSHARGSYDSGQLAAILDEAVFCHLGFLSEGYPVVLPILHARLDERVYLHSSSAGRLVKALRQDPQVCLTVTFFDGLVLARSAYEHSANYRSAMIFGSVEHVGDEQEKLTALQAFTERLIPGRWDEVRKPTKQELKATAVFRLGCQEASVKIRQGPPDDSESEDASLPVWAGEVPYKGNWCTPVADPVLDTCVALPPYLQRFGAR